MKRAEGWDSCRYSGDRDFWTTDEIGWIGKTVWDEIYRRPVDFEAARKWVEANIEPEGNKMRLLNVLNLMEKDENLWMYGSW